MGQTWRPIAPSQRTDYRQVGCASACWRRWRASIRIFLPLRWSRRCTRCKPSASRRRWYAGNRSFHRLLLAGVPVEFVVGDDKRTDWVQLIDFAQPQHNEFLLVNQFTVAGSASPRRPDLVALSMACRWR